MAWRQRGRALGLRDLLARHRALARVAPARHALQPGRCAAERDAAAQGDPPLSFASRMISPRI